MEHLPFIVSSVINVTLLYFLFQERGQKDADIKSLFQQQRQTTHDLLETHGKERQALLDRVMARNFVEYKEQTDPISNFQVDTPKEQVETVDIEDAQSVMLDEEDNG